MISGADLPRFPAAGKFLPQFSPWGEKLPATTAEVSSEAVEFVDGCLYVFAMAHTSGNTDYHASPRTAANSFINSTTDENGTHCSLAACLSTPQGLEKKRRDEYAKKNDRCGVGGGNLGVCANTSESCS